MMRISAVDSDQISAVNRETITSAKTVRMKDIMALRKVLKHVENQVATFERDLGNPTFWQLSDANKLKRVFTDLGTLSERVSELTGKIETSTYPHHASKIANLKKMSTQIDALVQRVDVKFGKSQRQAHVMREGEERHRANHAENVKACIECRQYVNPMIDE